MKLKYKMEYIDIDGNPMAVPVGCEKEFKGVLHMNGTTASILKALEKDVTEKDIVAALKKEYDAGEEQILASVQKVIAILSEYHLLSD